ncbi:MAG: type II secretion system F family protein [Betaproteobacteria bacterium]|nr:MAG: type II secretion system F family protein [Betaproteobacteria bacterium]
MPLYSYKAIDASGRAALGRLEAQNLLDLEHRLARMGLDLVTGAPGGSAAGASRRRKVGRRDLINFCFHLEQLTKAGIPLIEGLADLRDSVETQRLREVLASLIESIQGGKDFSQSLAAHPDVFGAVFVSLVRSGEHAGRLPEVLSNLAGQLRWEDELAAQTRKLMLYPAFVGTLVLAVTLFLLIYLVPQMAGFIRNLGQEVPLQTRILLRASELCVGYGWVAAGFAVALAGAARALVRSDGRFGYALDRCKISLPLIGPILRKIILARFASSFALMYASGIMVLEAMRYTEAIMGNRPLQGALRAAGQRVAEGAGLASAFADAELFPPLVVRMLRIGEHTGALDTALRNVSYFYNREVREAIDRLQSMIEPVLTVALGAILAWVMLAVLGPVYNTISVVKL